MFGIVSYINEGVLTMQEHNEKLAYSIEELTRQGPFGRTKIFSEIKSGRLKAKKFGKRTIITAEALTEWLNNLPGMGEAV